MPKKKTSKPKRPPKPHGHYCHACGRRRPNEKFSGSGHASHICRECVNEKRAERKRENEMKAFGPAYLVNRKRIAVELNYENWKSFLWQDEIDLPVSEFPYEDDGIYDVDWGIDKYDSYIDSYGDDEDENSFNGNWYALIEAASGDDRAVLKRYRSHLETARLLAECLAPFPEVRKIILFGEYARPPYREPNPKHPEKRGVLHRPEDLDIAIWLSSTENLHHMRRLRAKTAADRSNKQTKFSEEQIRIHIFEAKTSEYLGRLCTQGRCPNNNPACQGEGCGKPPFVKPFSELSLDPEAFEKRNCQVLFARKPKPNRQDQCCTSISDS